MKFRAICFTLVALVSMTSGCLYSRHPCWGFRLHPCQTGGGMCAPACSSPINRPLLNHKRSIAPGCPTCIGDGSFAAPPMGAFPSMAYPPVIGTPYPIPGPKVIPSGELPNPMPVKPGGF